jgi:hypothetical protein
MLPGIIRATWGALMSKKGIPFAVAVLTAISLIGASTASAATEFGDTCVGNETTESEPVTFFALTAAGNPLSLTAPSAGVITKWKSNLVPAPVSIPLTLKVLRQNGPNTVQLIGESSGNITGGSNAFDTRIPVQAGDRLGLFGSSPFGVIFCESPGPENTIGGFPGGGGGVGSTNTFVQISAEARFPVSAVLEPDADNDGFGDETQDKCPQSAAAQVACPVIALSASSIVKRGSVTVLITSSGQAPVTVAGTVKLGKGKTAKLNGGTQVVAPGTIARFTILFPKALKQKLKQLSRSQKLSLNLTATATNLVGAPTSTPLKAKVKGQAKPKPKRAAKRGKSQG